MTIAVAQQALTRCNTMRFQVRTLTGKTVHLEAPDEGDVLVEDVKRGMFEAECIPPDQQRLIFAGRQMEDGRSIQSYGVQDKSILHLVLRLRGNGDMLSNHVQRQHPRPRSADVRADARPYIQFDEYVRFARTTSVRMVVDGEGVSCDTMWAEEARMLYIQPRRPFPNGARVDLHIRVQADCADRDGRYVGTEQRGAGYMWHFDVASSPCDGSVMVHVTHASRAWPREHAMKWLLRDITGWDMLMSRVNARIAHPHRGGPVKGMIPQLNNIHGAEEGAGGGGGGRGGEDVDDPSMNDYMSTGVWVDVESWGDVLALLPDPAPRGWVLRLHMELPRFEGSIVRACSPPPKLDKDVASLE
jgi:hypothetical protein